MRYCPRCILPDTRPRLWFDDQGNCNCATREAKSQVDWPAREGDFRDLAERAKARRAAYDCVIPVSGGKDSHWQVIKCLEYGMRPLCVTWKTPARNELGARNLANLLELGVDHIDFQINPKVERRFMLKTLEDVGSPAVPLHLSIHAIPLRIATLYRIPLVVWGENSAFEYGGDAEERRDSSMNWRWFRKSLATNGTLAEDWVGDGLTREDLTPYFLPSDEELEGSGVLAVFLGYYFSWDPVETFRVARVHGFQERTEGPKTGYYDFADIDDEFLISIHHFLKWYKFGFTRHFDNLSIEIRNGRMSRDEAIRIIAESGDPTPYEDIEKFCAYVGISRSRFFRIIEKFRNPEIWTKRKGKWVIEGFLVPDLEWA